MQTFLDLDGEWSGECFMGRVESKEAIAFAIGREVPRRFFGGRGKGWRNEEQESATDRSEDGVLEGPEWHNSNR